MSKPRFPWLPWYPSDFTRRGVRGRRHEQSAANRVSHLYALLRDLYKGLAVEFTTEGARVSACAEVRPWVQDAEPRSRWLRADHDGSEGARRCGAGVASQIRIASID